MFETNNIFVIFILCNVVLQRISEALPQARNAVPTNITAAPYLVQILSEADFLCAGTLISDRFVVTTARSIENLDPKLLMVIGGATYRSEVGSRSAVNETFIPRNYTRKSAYLDVAVLRLAVPLSGSSVKAINLCTHEWSPGDPVKIFGWGKKANCGRFPNQMHEINGKVFDTLACKKKYHSLSLRDSMFCGIAPYKGVCYADPGSPVIVHGELCGIASWGSGCYQRNQPNVFTNVLKVIDFIHDVLRDQTF